MATRARILDSAEALFAAHGFHGTSVREIATKAEVQFALVAYHFGSKSDLLDEAVSRRVEVLNRERAEFIDEQRALFKAKPIPIRTLIDGFVGSFIARAASEDPGWRNYAQLVAALANAAEWKDLIHRHFNPIANLYIDEIRRTYPKAPIEPLYQSFFFAIGAMVAVCARPGRIESLSQDQYRSEDVSTLYDNLCQFLEGGFDRVAGSGSKASRTR